MSFNIKIVMRKYIHFKLDFKFN